jgi:8-oxo-dGTP diphosphatase
VTVEPASIEAAGGVLWRFAAGGDREIEVALVHRPKYDDWSLPKGKLAPGEHPLVGGLRELAEETGCAAVPGRPLGELRYLAADGRPKRVRYWACRALDGGDFRPGSEVDELAWLGLDRAAERLSPRHDRPILERFAADPRETRALAVVRHASAGDRDAWPGDDRDRPLDPLGQAQAAGLAPVLTAYGVRRAVAAALLRCRATLEPAAAAAGLRVQEEPAITAATFAQDPDAGIAAALELARGPAAALCSQREVIADLVAGVAGALGRPVPPDAVGEPEKGALVVLHLAGADRPELAGLDLLPPAG